MPTVGRSLPCAALSLALVAACGASGGTPDEDLNGLVHARVEPAPQIDVPRAGKDAAVAIAALTLPEHHLGKALGGYTLTAKSTVTIKDGSTVLEELTDDVTLEVDPSGAFHATDNNSADYGREIIFTGGTLYLRPRYARWHGRAPEGDGELPRLRDDLASTLSAHVELVAHALAVADKGTLDQAGRPAHKIALDRMQDPPAAPAQTLGQRAWRTGATVDALAGEAILDDKTGAPLHAHLEAQVGFVRDGKRLTMAFTVDHDLTAIGAAHPIAAPPADQVVATPERLREVDERDQLLDGMAPPARKKAAVPTPSDPAAPPPTPATGGKATP